VVFLALALVLPLMALRRRKLGWSRGWRMAAFWFGLFVLAAILFNRIGM
jgi:hypothetical protein